MGVTALKAPGPHTAKQTPGRPVTRIAVSHETSALLVVREYVTDRRFVIERIVNRR